MELIGDTSFNLKERVASELKEYGYTEKEANTNGQVSWENSQDGCKYIAKMNTVEDTEAIMIHVYKITVAETTEVTPNVGEQIKGTIAKWYYILRSISLILMLLVLVYLGIRIMLSSVSNEKAKYKTMLSDWCVALCLLFLMHYIMSFSMNLNDKFISLIQTISTSDKYIVVYEDENGKIEKALRENPDLLQDVQTDDGQSALEKIIDTSSTPHKIVWNAGDLMGLYRVNAALQASGTLTYVGYVLAFLVLVWYTIFFLFAYIKRIIYLAFLTMIAPVVALTYPIDKVRDGKAQAFEMWFKEYIGNLVIQPVHLILYTVLIGAAFDLSSKNVLYTLVAIGFMLPAEKFIKKMFGLDRAQTPGTLGGAIGAGFAMSAMNKLLHIGHHPPKPQGIGNGSKNSNDEAKDDGITKSIDLSEAGKEGDVNLITAKKEFVDDDKIDKKFANEPTPELKSSGAFPKDFKDNEISEVGPQINSELGNEKTKQTSKLKRMLKGSIGASKEYARQRLQRTQRAFDNVSNGTYFKNVGRVATGAIVGTGAGLIGASIGIASEDPSKILQYGAGLGAAGYALGSSRRGTSVDMNAVKKEYEMSQYDTAKEYREAMLKEQADKFVNDSNTIKSIQREFECKSEKEARELAKSYEELYKYGIKDLDTYIASMKISRDKKWSVPQTAAVAKLYKKAGGKPSGMKAKDFSDFRSQVEKIAVKKHEDVESQEKFISTVMNNVEDFGKAKDSLKEV